MLLIAWARAVEYANCTSEEGLGSLNQCLRYDTKQSDGEAAVLKIRGILSTPSMLLHPGPFWLGVVVTHRAQSMGQIELYCVKKMSSVSF